VESLNALLVDLLDLSLGHEVNTSNTVNRVELSLLGNHVLIKHVHKENAVLACRDKAALIK
jgi:hypothetical protein